MNHIRHDARPLCGRADWERLVSDESPDNECWECASIAGVEQPSDRLTREGRQELALIEEMRSGVIK